MAQRGRVTCAWPQGCGVTNCLDDDGLCGYHAKLAAGLIETTRGDGHGVVPVALTALQQARADRAKRDRWEAIASAEEERRRKIRRTVEQRYRELLRVS